MRKLRVIGIALAATLLIGGAVPSAWAYFTARDRADGSVSLRVGSVTEVNDSYKDLVKTISVTNTEGAPVWVRAQVFVGESYKDAVTIKAAGWNTSGNWYVYATPLLAGQTTSDLTVDISGVPADNLDVSASQFNVAVVYESCPATYAADGTPLAPNWNQKLDTGVSAPAADTGAGASEGGEQ